MNKISNENDLTFMNPIIYKSLKIQIAKITNLTCGILEHGISSNNNFAYDFLESFLNDLIHINNGAYLVCLESKIEYKKLFGLEYEADSDTVIPQFINSYNDTISLIKIINNYCIGLYGLLDDLEKYVSYISINNENNPEYKNTIFKKILNIDNNFLGKIKDCIFFLETTETNLIIGKTKKYAGELLLNKNSQQALFS